MTRIRDTQVLKAALLKTPSCPLCDRMSTAAHHILFRSQGGDDVLPNLVGLDLRCHDRIHGEDRVVRALLGEYILHERWDTLRYLQEKLGDEWRDWYERRLCVDITFREELSV